MCLIETIIANIQLFLIFSGPVWLYILFCNQRYELLIKKQKKKEISTMSVNEQLIQDVGK